MPSILVVDDAALDRRMVEAILATCPEYQVNSVEGGNAALDRIPELQPDLVVSDLQMPNMNGLELVSNIQLHHPDLPVVLTTAHGSEDLAVEALRVGAASYVPKTQLADLLLPTIEEVLATIGQERTHSRLSACVDSAAFTFTIENDLALVGSLVGMLQNVAGNSVRFQPGRLHRFSFGLAAALTYMMCRGNLGWTLAEFEELHVGREDAVNRAMLQTQQPPYADRKLRVQSHFTATNVTIEIEHQGDALNDELAQFRPEEAMSSESGARGLVLMCAFFSSVQLLDGRRLILSRESE